MYNYRSYYLNTKDNKIDPSLSFRELPFATSMYKRPSLL